MNGPHPHRHGTHEVPGTGGVGAVRRLSVVATVALGMVAVACGTASDDGEPTPTGRASTPSEGRSASPPSLSAPTPGAEIQLSGVVRASPEDRVVTLEASAGSGQPARTWVLVGPVRSLVDGERVTVVGRPDLDADTTGQRGPVFRVESVERS